MPPGRWRDRFIFALKTSLHVLEPHQVALRALTPVLVGDPEEGIFSASTAFSRLRVQQVFEQAVAGSSDAPKQPLAAALGRLSVSRSPGRASVVAAGQEFEPARDRRTGVADAATAALCGAEASCSAGSTVRDLRRRAGS